MKQSTPPVFRIGRRLRDQLIDHARRAAPEECCGILLGQVLEGDVVVEHIVKADNIADGNRTTTFQIDWRSLFVAVKSTKHSQETIVGFYHSHPQGGSAPSRLDLGAAWPNSTCVIVSNQADGIAGITCWYLPRLGGPFISQPLVVV